MSQFVSKGLRFKNAMYLVCFVSCQSKFCSDVACHNILEYKLHLNLFTIKSCWVSKNTYFLVWTLSLGNLDNSWKNCSKHFTYFAVFRLGLQPDQTFFRGSRIAFNITTDKEEQKQVAQTSLAHAAGLLSENNEDRLDCRSSNAVACQCIY